MPIPPEKMSVLWDVCCGMGILPVLVIFARGLLMKAQNFVTRLAIARSQKAEEKR